MRSRIRHLGGRVKSQRVIIHREQSRPALCEYVLCTSNHFGTMRCGAPMLLTIKEPQFWSYQIRVSERCMLNHLAHGQAVVEPPEENPWLDCGGTF